jgi:hypothetical protein
MRSDSGAMRLRIEYADHNESFAAQLPRVGTVVARPKACDSAHQWHLVRLDSPVIYNGEIHSHVLIASRWEGYLVGSGEPTGVFILVVPPAVQVADGFSHREFPHVAWGMAHAA